MTEPSLDKRRVRRFFARAAASYDAAAVLQREVGRRLDERLDLIRLVPKTILDLGCGTGEQLQSLMRRYPRARVVALDLALPMLQRARRRGRWLRRRPACLCGDMEALPLADRSIDLIHSNLAFQWAADPDRLFRECLRVLRPGGLLLFTTFGPDTLSELRRAWSQVDRHQHVSEFIDMHDLGDALLRAGFADPVMDVERLVLTYAEVDDLLADLRALGARNATAGRPRGLAGRARLEALRRAYEGFRRRGVLPATWEVVHGHAWAPEGPLPPPRRPEVLLPKPR